MRAVMGTGMQRGDRTYRRSWRAGGPLWPQQTTWTLQKERERTVQTWPGTPSPGPCPQDDLQPRLAPIMPRSLPRHGPPWPPGSKLTVLLVRFISLPHSSQLRLATSALAVQVGAWGDRGLRRGTAGTRGERGAFQVNCAFSRWLRTGAQKLSQLSPHYALPHGARLRLCCDSPPVPLGSDSPLHF